MRWCHRSHALQEMAFGLLMLGHALSDCPRLVEFRNLLVHVGNGCDPEQSEHQAVTQNSSSGWIIIAQRADSKHCHSCYPAIPTMQSWEWCFQYVAGVSAQHCRTKSVSGLVLTDERVQIWQCRLTSSRVLT